VPNNIAHFAIHADDVERARAFYTAVFGWQFEAWGPPGFFMIRTGTDDDPGIHGSLQKRSEPMQAGGPRTFECTVGVADVDAIAAAVKKHGGTLRHEKMHLVGVGWLVGFVDTEGNHVSAMQYE
jgi:predicted enzyme related to lactoylglutathione lyase